MKTLILALVGIFAVMLMSLPSSAQPETCPALVSQALAAAGEVCGGIGRNQACYGNVSLSATPRHAAVTLNFNTAGDLVGVEQIATLQLAALTEAAGEWGVAVMALQANLPDTLPGQNATIILFGDVTIEDRSDVATPLPDVFVYRWNDQVANVRQTPSTEAARVGGIDRTPQRAVGRLDSDGSWFRVALDDGTDGWVTDGAVNVDGDWRALPISSPDADAPQTSYGSMQAFRLKTGIVETACSEAPADGIIIQTPDGAGEVVFEINQVTLKLSSTAVMRTTDSTMRIALVEGQAGIEVAGHSDLIRAGRVGVFALDANGDATGEYTVEHYTDADVASLPIALLPRQVEVRSADDIAALLTAPVRDGRWTVLHATRSGTGTGADADACEYVNEDPDLEDEDPGLELEGIKVTDVFVTANADGTLTITSYFTYSDFAYTRDDDGVWRTPTSVYEDPHSRFIFESEYIFEGDTGSATAVTTYDADEFSWGGAADFTCFSTTQLTLAFVGD